MAWFLLASLIKNSSTIWVKGLAKKNYCTILQHSKMNKSRNTYNVFQIVSSVFMILALLWLTMSAPFVFSGQQLQAKYKAADTGSPLATTEEEAANPFGNTTEEKASGSTSFSEEFLHDYHKAEYFFSKSAQYHKAENTDLYTAFHGELLVPPPNIA
jgi:hypothetical protein